MQAARRIDDDIIHFARLCRLQSIEDNRAWIGAGFLPDRFQRPRVGPDLQLLNGGGAKSIRSAQQYFAAFAQEAVGEFADGRGLPRPVDAHQHHDGGRLPHDVHRRFGSAQNFKQVFADEIANFARIAGELAVDTLANPLQDILHGAHAQIGGDQRVFKLFEKIGIDLFPARQYIFKPVDQA